jgi:hypothetical protein
MMNISEVEPKLAQNLGDLLRKALRDLSYSLPENYRPQVALLDANGRKKRSNAAADNWSPESGGRIMIWFEPATHEQKTATAISRKNESPSSLQSQANPVTESGAKMYVHPAEAELLQALDRAESRPGWNFVPLKKFRDEILPLEHCPSMRTDVEQHHMLRSAIEKRLVLVGKVPNPKAPQFPVTTIRLNRLMAEVKAALGHGGNEELDFRPVEITGEPLSATILRERR